MAGLIRRGKQYYATYSVGGKERRKALGTDSKQIAKELVRQLASSLLRGEPVPLPTRTPLADMVTDYVEYIEGVKTFKSAKTDIYYLRNIFGPICPALRPSRKTSENTRKKPLEVPEDKRRRDPVIECHYLEDITTAQISTLISTFVRRRGLAPKTANRYREILTRLFNWAMKERGIRVPGDKNPAAAVERYKQHAPRIRFLTLRQVDEQLAVLAEQPLLQAMVATYIYAGLRREEAVWLQMADVDLSAGEYGVIRIRPKDINGDSWEPKTKSNRAVPISSTLRRHLDRYQPRVTKGRFFFPSPQGERYNPDNFSRDLRKIQKKHGLQWGCLDFRHTFGSQLAQKGESLYKISALMGNSPEICRRHYAALVPEAMADAVEFEQAPAKKPRKTGGANLRLA